MMTAKVTYDAEGKKIIINVYALMMTAKVTYGAEGKKKK